MSSWSMAGHAFKNQQEITADVPFDKTPQPQSGDIFALPQLQFLEAAVHPCTFNQKVVTVDWFVSRSVLQGAGNSDR
ncbi:hypothetical protein CVT25_013696 [Psilocybe cyanescens]|uniref:Uncharacterized protein n=1 Tax=Psilocybe cyanescens TaxID=93625 RepID=A0A409XLH1_PSICY|nr:hypothetical protein CVT25_013696 [Psilocybe cyanescens]